jgi:hypothetical protein
MSKIIGVTVGTPLSASSVANALKDSASGNPIRLDDVSPLEHEMAVNISNGATLQRYGKNLLPKDYFYHFPDKDDTQCFIYGMQHGTYTLSGWVTKYPDDTSTATRLKLVVFYKDGTTNLLFVGMDYECAECDGVPRYKEGSITTDFTKEIDRIQVALDYSVRNNPNRIAENVMLEFGSTATEYEPYIEPTTYTADDNGNVKGVTSLYPTTTLIADSGAIISAEYNKDTNKVVESLVNAIISLGGNV